MKIYIDADACPVVSIAEKVAAKFQIPVTLLCDTNHILQSDYSDVIVVDAGADAVDYKLISLCTKDDVVITQDYGVAAMALGKGGWSHEFESIAVFFDRGKGAKLYESSGAVEFDPADAF